jgi:linoleoyl-CoA desaturase
MPAHKTRFHTSSDFHSVLKSRVAGHLADEGLRSRDLPLMYGKTAIILTWLLGSYLALLLWAHSRLTVVGLAVSLGLAMAALGFNIQHDGNHGGYSDRPLVNRLMALTLDLVGGSSYVWHWKHNVIHHSYSNIAHVDADTEVGLFARLTPHHAWHPAHRFQHFYVWLLYGLLPFKWIFFDDFRDLMTGRIGTQQFPGPSRWGLAGILAMKVFYVSWAVALPLWLCPTASVAAAYSIAAVTLGTTLAIVFQVAHCLEPATFPLPDREGWMPSDWAVHQVETTVNFAPGSRLLTWFLGGLNYQVEHHLFPRICHLHYPGLAPIVAATCAEYGVRYQQHPTFLRALQAHARWLRLLGQAQPQYQV